MPASDFKDSSAENRIFTFRAIQAAFIVFLVLCGVIARMYYLQVIEHEHFQTLSTDNRVKLQPIPPSRGLIFDRNGVPLAQNLPSYSLEVTPEEVDDIDQMIEDLSEVIEITKRDIKRFKRLSRHKRRFDSFPIRVHLNDEELARFAVNRHKFPGVDIKATLTRNYPEAELTSHVLGYVGRINKKELQKLDETDKSSNYSGTTHIGKTGVEKYYEDQLHGTVGTQKVEVNVVGRVIRVLDETPPKQGKNLYLTLDIELQRTAMEAFEDHNGSAVAIDPKTGEILAIASKPGFNANLFVEGISSKDYTALRESPDKPLFNRAIRGTYPPGSTSKPFVVLAGLEGKHINHKHSIYCGGYFQLPNRDHKYRDWKKWGHGKTDVIKSMEQSCDVFYYDLAHQMGVDNLHAYLSLFGFGSRTGVDIYGESSGILPSREWKRKRQGIAWYPGETVIMGIGQGYFTTTPIQLASATATLVSKGVRQQPHIVKSSAYLGEQPEVSEYDSSKLPIRNMLNWEVTFDSMLAVVEGEKGTARRIRNTDYRVAGKTGTAQVFTVAQDEEYDEDKISKKNRDHALFIAYAPIDDPQIAVAVIVENGGHGGSVAAPIAKKILDAYLVKNPQKEEE